MGVSAIPPKANPPLIVDAYAVLTFAISCKRLQVIARRNAQIPNVFRCFNHRQLPERALLNVRRKRCYAFPLEQALRVPASERLNHRQIITAPVMNVKRY
jgi:hypothetical protein